MTLLKKIGWLPGLFLLSFLCGEVRLQAASYNYQADELLSRITVSLPEAPTGPIRLADIFSAIEKQTKLEFIYLPSEIPVTDRVVIASARSVTVASLLRSISTMTNVVFLRDDQKIVVRLRRPGDTISAIGASDIMRNQSGAMCSPSEPQSSAPASYSLRRLLAI